MKQILARRERKEKRKSEKMENAGLQDSANKTLGSDSAAVQSEDMAGAFMREGNYVKTIRKGFFRQIA